MRQRFPFRYFFDEAMRLFDSAYCLVLHFALEQIDEMTAYQEK